MVNLFIKLGIVQEEVSDMRKLLNLFA